MLRNNRIIQKYFGWALDTSREAHIRVLSQVPLFKGMGDKLLRKLLIDLIDKKYAPGDVIFYEGDRGKALYVILEGAVKITKETSSGKKTLAVLEPGSHFGELALVDHCPRFATAIAEKETLLLIMYKSYFDDLLIGNSAISVKILLNLAGTLSNYIHCGRPDGDDRDRAV